MSILNIKKYPDQILKKKAAEVKKITKDIKTLAFEMIETMDKNQGVGLAAPQVGESKRIIVIYRINSRSQRTSPKAKPEVFINPKIIKKSRETEYDEEGCLSVPEVFLKIKRAKEVEVESLDLGGKKILIKAKGLPARIFQHEIDHLDGILFFERLSFWQKTKFKTKLSRRESAGGKENAVLFDYRAR